MRKVELNGTVAWLAFSVVVMALAAGCHGDAKSAGQGAGTAAQPVTVPQVPKVPTADQVDPDSPRAVLYGTSTVQTGRPAKAR